MNKEELVDRVKQRREELGISQEELSDYTGLSPSTINKFENNKMNLSIERLFELLDVLALEMNLTVKN